MITTGVTSNQVTEVLQGLGAGERVATSRLDALTDGAPVQAGAAPAPAAAVK
jgi:hypothetical protein